MSRTRTDQDCGVGELSMPCPSPGPWTRRSIAAFALTVSLGWACTQGLKMAESRKCIHVQLPGWLLHSEIPTRAAAATSPPASTANAGVEAANMSQPKCMLLLCRHTSEVEFDRTRNIKLWTEFTIGVVDR